MTPALRFGVIHGRNIEFLRSSLKVIQIRPRRSLSKAASQIKSDALGTPPSLKLKHGKGREDVSSKRVSLPGLRRKNFRDKLPSR